MLRHRQIEYVHVVTGIYNIDYVDYTLIHLVDDRVGKDDHKVLDTTLVGAGDEVSELYKVFEDVLHGGAEMFGYIHVRFKKIVTREHLVQILVVESHWLAVQIFLRIDMVL